MFLSMCYKLVQGFRVTGQYKKKQIKFSEEIWHLRDFEEIFLKISYISNISSGLGNGEDLSCSNQSISKCAAGSKECAPEGAPTS